MAKERWASRLGLVLAMAGNAVGLGNFLRFPAQAVKNGGGAFMIPYLVALLLLGLPLIWVEWTMGRYGGRYGHHSMPGNLDVMGRRWFWKYLGVFGLWINLIIASYYLYIESWTMAYAGYSLIGGFATTDPKEFYVWVTGDVPNQIRAFTWLGATAFALCIVINIWVLSRGLAKGIELVCKVGMPLLIIFGMVLAARGLLIEPGKGPNAVDSPWADPQAIESPLTGLNFVWEPKFDRLSDPSVWLAAAGQIFFTLGIGMGMVHCYASYVRDTDDITLTGSTAAWTNEFCEVVLGGTILIPIAVAYLGLDEVARTAGFGMCFTTMPTLFQNWGPVFGPLSGFMWFGLLFFAAITSSLAMGQPIMAFLQTEFGLTRHRSALALAAMLVPLAAPVAFLSEKTFFDEFDFWAGTLALVVFALIETVLFAWVFGMDRGWREMHQGAELRVPRVFYYVIKYVTPVFLILILTGYVFQPKIGWGDVAGRVAAGEPLPAWEWSGDSMIGRLLHIDLDQSLANDKAARPQQQDWSKETAFIDAVRFWRTVDRLVLVVTFVGFALLVSSAWKKRKAEGRLL
jgi:SNF family Na+-dependent transporter